MVVLGLGTWPLKWRIQGVGLPGKARSKWVTSGWLHRLQPQPTKGSLGGPR